jgi:hypothetical protein
VRPAAIVVPIRTLVTRALITLVLAATILAGGSSTSIARSKKAIWGPVDMPDGSSAFPVYRDLGVRVLQRLWSSEFTISSDRGNRVFREYVSRANQARWLRAAFRIARRSPWIAGMGWFNLHDDPKGMPGGLTTGLMTYEGKRKPAYYAYRRAR